MEYGPQETFNLKPNPTKLIMLGLIAITFCLSVFLSVFAAIPLAFGVLVYGRKLGYLSAFVFGLISLALSLGAGAGFGLVSIYAFSLFIAIICIESVLRNFNPMKTILFGGIALFIVSSVSILGYLKSQDTTLKAVTVKFIETNAQALKENVFNSNKAGNVEEEIKSLKMLQNPEKTADEVIKEIPGYMMLTNFLLLWFVLYLLLKYKRLKYGLEKDQYTDHDLLNFKVPDHYIWLVIISLGLLIWGNEIGEWHTSLGHFLIQSLGAFYFFQGFGLYMAFLNFVNFYGFLRVVLVSITVFTAGSIIAILGLFDMFIDFRKYLKKKEI